MTRSGWASAALGETPEEGTRYEIIDGELYVAKQPSTQHQLACGNVWDQLDDWNQETGLGRVIFAPGVIFADNDNVAPDVVWLSHRWFAEIVGADGHRHGPPELVVEVLAPGALNEWCARQAKLSLYSRRGADEYWIVDWWARTVDVFRREGDALRHLATRRGLDRLESPLLPGFQVAVEPLFVAIPEAGP